MTSGIAAEDWIAHHARFAPRAEAAHDLASGRRFTYAAFDERITRAALWLARAFGVAPGDRVAVLSMNDTDVFELQFACRRLGAIFLPLNWRLAVPELEFICKDSGPVVLIHGEEFADAARADGASRRRAPHRRPGQRRAQRLRGGAGGGTRHPRSAGAGSDRHLDDHVHLGHDRPPEGRGDHLPDGRVQRHPVRHDGRADGAEPQPGVPADLPYRRPQRLRQPDLPYRRLQRGDAELRPRRCSCGC